MARQKRVASAKQKAKNVERQRLRRLDPAYVAEERRLAATPECRAKLAEQHKVRWADPVFRAKNLASEQMRMADPVKRAKKTATARVRLNDPVKMAEMVAQQLVIRAKPEYKAKLAKRDRNRYDELKHKEARYWFPSVVELPSGSLVLAYKTGCTTRLVQRMGSHRCSQGPVPLGGVMPGVPDGGDGDINRRLAKWQIPGCNEHWLRCPDVLEIMTGELGGIANPGNWEGERDALDALFAAYPDIYPKT